MGVAPYYQNNNNNSSNNEETMNDPMISSPQRSITTSEDFSPIKQSQSLQMKSNLKDTKLPEEFNWLSNFNEDEWVSIEQIAKKNSSTTTSTAIVSSTPFNTQQSEEEEEVLQDANQEHDDNGKERIINNDHEKEGKKNEFVDDEWDDQM